MTTPDAIPTHEPEQYYMQVSTPSHRKRYGQFFTPFEIADLMSSWVVGSRERIRLLDPGSGTLVFERAIGKLYPHGRLSVDCYEVDELILEFSRQIAASLSGLSLQFRNSDYLMSNTQDKYDGIICNPPYYKHHRVEDKELVHRLIGAQTSYSFSLSTNVHCLFLIKAMTQLSVGGRLAFIMPTEFLNSNYGVAVKRYLLDSGFLRYIVAFDYRVSVFSNALTTACIVLLANDDDNGAPIQFLSLASLQEVALLHDFLRANTSVDLPVMTHSPRQLDPGTKWSNYFTHQRELEMLAPFTEYAKVKRGIATGYNRYFTLSKDNAAAHQIDTAFLVPCITKAHDASSIVFTQEMFDRLESIGKRCHLLYLNDKELNAHVREYLKYGEGIGVHERYLSSHRSPWYRSEDRDPSPIWVTVFSRRGLRFVRNEAGVRNLTCFHSVYLTDKGARNTDLFMAYLISPVCQEVFLRQRREYGNGLVKFEPDDINESHVLDLEKIGTETRHWISEKYQLIRQAALARRDDEALSLISEVDSAFRSLLGASMDAYLLQTKLI